MPEQSAIGYTFYFLFTISKQEEIVKNKQQPVTCQRRAFSPVFTGATACFPQWPGRKQPQKSPMAAARSECAMKLIFYGFAVAGTGVAVAGAGVALGVGAGVGGTGVGVAFASITS